jgi:hypothetical protein
MTCLVKLPCVEFEGSSEPVNGLGFAQSTVPFPSDGNDKTDAIHTFAQATPVLYIVESTAINSRWPYMWYRYLSASTRTYARHTSDPPSCISIA